MPFLPSSRAIRRFLSTILAWVFLGVLAALPWVLEYSGIFEAMDRLLELLLDQG